MSEKITITKLKAAPDFDPLHHPVGAMMSTGEGTIVTFPYYREDQIGNFNEAARQAFNEYIEGKDLTPKRKDLYTGKILFVDKNKCSINVAANSFEVKDGLIPNFQLLLDENLRIEKNLFGSKLAERVGTMYFGDTWHKYYDVIYLTDD